MSVQQQRIQRRAAGPVPDDFSARLHPVMARLYASRGVQSVGELDLVLSRLFPAHSLAGLESAVDLLTEAMERRLRILVVGDFDADGATSTAVAVRALRAMGAAHVDFLVPDRFRFGYGLTPEIVDVAAARGPDLLVTVDNGISSFDGVAAARARGMRVLITDHHLPPGGELPGADAIVNPNQPGCDFPSKCLAGVGVIFYVLTALRARLRADGWFAARGIEAPNLAHYLDLVALGTVADVVPLDGNNRILVAQGLARLRAGQCSAGVRALIATSARKQDRLVAADLGYAVAPRLNAAGRLDDMALGIRCLLCDDHAEAAQLAAELERLNGERRAIEAVMKEEASALLGRMRLAADLPAGLCLYQSGWHEGVLGIIASRLKDQLHRPVIVFTDTTDDNIKGSARSVAGVHIRDTLDAVAASAPGLLLRFGGHAMAAGLALRRSDFERFAAAFDAQVRERMGVAEMQGIVSTDGELAAEHLNLEIAEQLRSGGPWGQGFPEPVFDGIFHIVAQRALGEKHLKFVLRPTDADRHVEAIAFNAPGEWARWKGAVRLAYRLEINEYRGERNLQLLIIHMEAAT